MRQRGGDGSGAAGRPARLSLSTTRNHRGPFGRNVTETRVVFFTFFHIFLSPLNPSNPPAPGPGRGLLRKKLFLYSGRDNDIGDSLESRRKLRPQSRLETRLLAASLAGLLRLLSEGKCLSPLLL